MGDSEKAFSLGWGASSPAPSATRHSSPPPPPPPPPPQKTAPPPPGLPPPGASGNEASAARLAPPTRIPEDTGPLPDAAYLHLLNARRVRRMSEYVKLSLAATAVAFADAGITDIPTFSATCAAVLGS